MNYQFNNIIVVILVIYILNFYQINCDNKTISVNNVSDSTNGSILTSSKPVQLDGVEAEVDPLSSSSVKKDNLGEIADIFYNISTHVGSTVTKPKIAKKQGVFNPPPPPSAANTSSQPYSENDMAVKSSERPILSTQPTNKVVVEPTKSNETELSSTVTKTITTTKPVSSTTMAPTKKPTKPHKTIASDDLPETAANPPFSQPNLSSSNMTINSDIKVNATQPTNTTLPKTILPIETPLHSVEELDRPNVQFSKEQIPVITSKRDYIIPVVALIFAIPIVLAIATIMFRRAKDYWETRHYRRMDFLIDEMYND